MQATTCMNLEDILLSEIKQSQRDKYCMIQFTCSAESSQIIEKESRMVVVRGWEKRK